MGETQIIDATIRFEVMSAMVFLTDRQRENAHSPEFTADGWYMNMSEREFPFEHDDLLIALRELRGLGHAVLMPDGYVYQPTDAGRVWLAKERGQRAITQAMAAQTAGKMM